MSKLTKKKEPKTTQLVKQNKINIADFSVEQRLELVTQYIQDVQPKIDFYDAVANSKDYLDIQQVSALLAYEGYGQNNLFKYIYITYFMFYASFCLFYRNKFIIIKIEKLILF